MSVKLDKYHLLVPNIEIAKMIFADGLGLIVKKQKKISDEVNSVSFVLNKNTTLYCWEVNNEKPRINAYSDSIELFAKDEDIKKAYELLKNENNVNVNFIEKDYLHLMISLKKPHTSINIASFPKEYE